MSWFKRSPPKYPPLQKHHLHPHRTSPATEKTMEESKKTGPDYLEKKKNNKY
jgi:hypothetical protein